MQGQGIYAAGYYPHNIHFLTASYAFQGRARETLESAKNSAHHSHGAINEPGFGLAHVLTALPKLVMVRFAQWENILALPAKGESPFDTGMVHFARGMAFIHTGKAEQAAPELAALESIASDPALDSLMISDINAVGQIAKIARYVLKGHLEFARGNTDAAIASLTKAVETDDALRYTEPPDWPTPPRHDLGAMLLKAKRAKEAEAVYRTDLKRFRNNGWSLRGLVASLEMQGRKDEAATVLKDFDKAWAKADVRIETSLLH